jgi:hypothetical protein
VRENIVTNGGLAWLLKRGFRIGDWIYSLRLQPHKLEILEAVSSTAQVVHKDGLLQQHSLNSGGSLNPSGTHWTNSSWSNQTARLAQLLNSISDWFLWLELHLPVNLILDSWTASHCPVQLFLTALSWSSTVLFSPVQVLVILRLTVSRPSLCGPQRDYRLSPSAKWLLTFCHGKANRQRVSLTWALASVWLLRKTSQYHSRIQPQTVSTFLIGSYVNKTRFFSF